MIIIAIVRRVFFAGQGVYWYLLVLAEAAFIVGILVRYKKFKLLYIVCIIGLIMGFIYDASIGSFGMDKMHQLFYTVFSWSNNVFMKGIPYVSIGYLFYKYEKLLRISIKKAILIYVLSSVGMIIIYEIGIKSLLVLYPVQAICLFIIVNRLTGIDINIYITKLLGNLSAAIYFLHTVFIYGVIDYFFGINASVLLKFVVSVAMSIGVYFVVYKFKIKSVQWLIGAK